MDPDICSAKFPILPHTHTFRCRHPGPVTAYLASHSTASGTVNTGGGGGASKFGTLAGNGGSGIVILSYPSAFTITIGAGLTGSTATVGANKISTITAGTGNVSWA